jgi:alpha/beta superfamily hydrolase
MPPSPEPRFNSTIPSIHDDTTLDFRIYHPDVLTRPPLGGEGTNKPWRRKGLVIAHPYAPMGGSYDDRVVRIVLDEFLKAGWIVATFNFRYISPNNERTGAALTQYRGAHGSKGRTSWSGRPELDDYISFAALFMHYMSHLQPSPAPDAVFVPEQSPISPRAQSGINAVQPPAQETPIVILGGYSYGSLILRHLPPVPSILAPFSAPLPGSAADEILLRARKLSDRSNLEWLNLARDLERERRKPPRSEKLGGEETDPDKRRSSRDTRRSMDGGRSLDIGNRLRSLSHRRHDEAVFKAESAQTESLRIAITMPEIRYLLISPLTAPISTLLAPALATKLLSRSTSSFPDVVAKHETLAVFGNQDVFSSSKRIREWIERMKGESGLRFHGVEVNGAGHFWHEEGSESELRAALRTWERRARESSVV